MGMTLREIIFGPGGGIKDDKKFKAVQLGGPSGGCIPEALLDTPVDYQSIKNTGAIMGSGGMVVMDETTCMVDLARYFLNFTQDESCGKCVPCRIGTKRMLEIMERLCAGEGKPGDIDLLEMLGQQIMDGSLCGLGNSAPNPVLTTIRYFRDEYEAHIYDKKCPAKQCKALITYLIEPDKCKGCTLCAKKCPVNCISGEAKKPHVIDQNLCTKCGTCLEVCPSKWSAVSVS
jgi:NADH-quinone oxidoreductase subunit F